MILTIYLGLLLLALIFIWTGFKIDNPVLEIGGFFFLFVLGLVLMNGNVEYKTGYFNDQQHVYGNNFTYDNGSATYHWDYDASGVPPTVDKGVFLFHIKEYKEDVYTKFDADTSGELLGGFSVNHLLGLLVAVFGGFGMAISMFNMKATGGV